ncbi:MAG: hypothetical protein IPM63_07980 [Acidobacteriota bacterium]|nr:MAG: hypothetical protein IPM63_07980 [Acidobacteriota bacterium]
MKRTTFFFLFFFSFSIAIFPQSGNTSEWLITFDAGQSGPLEAVIVLERDGDKVAGRSKSGSLKTIAALPQAKAKNAVQGDALFSFSAVMKGAEFRGKLTAPTSEGEIVFTIKGDSIEGSISGGPMRSKFRGVPSTGQKLPLRDYRAVAESLRVLCETRVYDPRTLDGPEWRALYGTITAIAASANDDLDMILGFRYAYENKPFSHLVLSRGRAPAKAMIEQFDQMKVGGKPASVRFEDGIAILRVETMIGLDTIELIEKAYLEIAEKKPRALIIDLRGNGGGAFAVKPLIEHIIDNPLDAGYFVTNAWYTSNERTPTKEKVLSTEPWTGYSLKAWWASIQTEPLIRLRFEPADPNFDGPVFILIDGRSASAAELAADAFKASGAVKLIGERTAGEMLTQSPFDLAEGFQAFVPVGDYFSMANGRIEGVGVEPHVAVPSEKALEEAIRLIK